MNKKFLPSKQIGHVFDELLLAFILKLSTLSNV